MTECPRCGYELFSIELVKKEKAMWVSSERMKALEDRIAALEKAVTMEVYLSETSPLSRRMPIAAVLVDVFRALGVQLKYVTPGIEVTKKK